MILGLNYNLLILNSCERYCAAKNSNSQNSEEGEGRLGTVAYEYHTTSWNKIIYEEFFGVLKFANDIWKA